MPARVTRRLSRCKKNRTWYVTRPRHVRTPTVKKIRARQDGHVDGDEVFPASVSAALGRRCDAVALQDVPDGLIGDVVTEIGECANDSIVTPAGILLFDPSNLRAISRRYQVRMVSGLVIHATSARYLRPSRLPISARVDLC